MKKILIAAALVVLSTSANAYGGGSSYTERYLQDKKDEAMYGSAKQRYQESGDTGWNLHQGGTMYRKSGNTTYGSDGSACTSIGSMVGC